MTVNSLMQKRSAIKPDTLIVGVDVAKFNHVARTLVPEPEINSAPGAKFGLITYGSSKEPVREARALLEQEDGVKTDLLRLRALPLTQSAIDFIENHEKVYVIEANRDGQMRQILSATLPTLAPRFRSAAHGDGMPLTARWIKETILAQEEKA